MRESPVRPHLPKGVTRLRFRQFAQRLAAWPTAALGGFARAVIGVVHRRRRFRCLPDEPLTTRRSIAVAIAFGGGIIRILPSLFSGVSSTLGGQLAVLGAALSYAFVMVVGRRFKKLSLNPVMASAGQFTMAAATLLRKLHVAVLD